MIATGTGKVSTDGGWTWADKSNALSRLKIEVFTSGYVWPFRLLSFRNGEIRAVFSQTNQWTGDRVVRIVRSRDLGDTWDEASSLPNHAVIGIENLVMEMLTERRMMLFFNPTDPSNAFIATLAYSKRQSFPVLSGSSVTRDEGQGRHMASNLLQETHRNSTSKRAGGDRPRRMSNLNDPQRTLFIGGSRGMWKSEDEGQAWKQLGGVQ